MTKKIKEQIKKYKNPNAYNLTLVIDQNLINEMMEEYEIKEASEQEDYTQKLNEQVQEWISEEMWDTMQDVEQELKRQLQERKEWFRENKPEYLV